MRTQLFAAVALTVVICLPQAAVALCKEGICVNGHDEGDTHYVDFTSNWNNVTHFNFSSPSGQRELGKNERQVTIPLRGSRPITIHYGLQACGGGGFLHKSGCSPWAEFEHTAQ